MGRKLDFKQTGNVQANLTYGVNWTGRGMTGRNTEWSQERGAEQGRAGQRTEGWSHLVGKQAGGREAERSGGKEQKCETRILGKTGTEEKDGELS